MDAKTEVSAIEKVSELSHMRKTLTAETLESLRNGEGNYVDRLDRVAKASFMKGELLGGTTVGRPNILTEGKRGRHRVEATPSGFAMYVREIKTDFGYLVMFPMHTKGLTTEGTPIIDPSLNKKSYTIAHLPQADGAVEIYHPEKMKADLAFTVDEDNLVTVNGMNMANSDEYALFDEIVREFESRLDLDQQ